VKAALDVDIHCQWGGLMTVAAFQEDR
jgi:hypothetical protein